MTYTLYDGTIAQLDKALDALTAILKKAEASPDAEKLVDARLHEDMLPLKFQVKMVTIVPQQVASRISGDEVSQGTDLNSFAEFHAAIGKAKAALAQTSKAAVDSKAETMQTIGFGKGRSMDLTLAEYLPGYAMSNVFFHVVTAYSILRKEGIDLGKKDYLGAFLDVQKIREEK